jgi:hypothetical protein
MDELLPQITGIRAETEVSQILEPLGFQWVNEDEYAKQEGGFLYVVSKDLDRSGKWFVFRLKGQELMPPDGRVRELVRLLRDKGVKAEILTYGTK